MTFGHAVELKHSNFKLTFWEIKKMPISNKYYCFHYFLSYFLSLFHARSERNREILQFIWFSSKYRTKSIAEVERRKTSKEADEPQLQEPEGGGISSWIKNSRMEEHHIRLRWKNAIWSTRCKWRKSKTNEEKEMDR